MENNMDGLKISVNNEGEGGVAKRKGRPKKAAKAEVVESRRETSSVKDSSEKKGRKAKGGFFSTLLTMIVTALIVGGAIYAWQESNSKKGVDSVREEARKVRVDFEQRMDQLKNKLSGVETENQKLKDTAKELEEDVSLLKGAKLEYSDAEFGFTFEYPAVLGEVKIEKTAGASGAMIKGTFSKNDKLSFGGITADYTPLASGTAASLMETQGFMEKGGKYYFQGLGKSDTTDHEFFPSIKTTGNALIIDKKSFAAAEGAAPYIDLGENVGAIVNTGSEKMRGLAFLNQDLAQMPIANLEMLIKSVGKK
jgi:hypothetical protein